MGSGVVKVETRDLISCEVLDHDGYLRVGRIVWWVLILGQYYGWDVFAPAG